MSTDPVVLRPVHSAPPATVQVQLPDVMDSREGLQTHSGSLIRDDSLLGEGGESIHETRGLVEVQVPSLSSVPLVVQGEFLENQINEIDSGLSCFDTNDGDAPTNAGLNVVIPFGQDMRSDLAHSFTPCDTNLNCFSTPNNSLVVSGDVSDSGSLLRGRGGGGKVVSTRQRRIMRMVF